MDGKGLKLLIAIFFSISFLSLASAEVLEVGKWTENSENPVFDPASKVYYPSVLKINDTYHMWYGSNSGIGYATSPDGLNWTEVQNPVSGLKNANHPVIEYIEGNFKIWYWDGSQLYSINTIRYAESVNGTDWVNDQAITGNIITGISPDWNRGTYGAIDILYNPTATNEGTNPFDYSYVMYFDGTTGSFEEIGLGYSTDGLNWQLYGKVLERGNDGAWGNTFDWDSSYTTFGTIIKESDNEWYMWYSGGQTDSNDGIGYATSTDGLTWIRDSNNPVLYYADGVSWRNDRTYTPVVIKDGEVYKMWFSGKDASGNYALGYATSSKPSYDYSSIQDAINAANESDIIEVYSGIYNETLQVDVNNLTIKAADGENPIIQSSANTWLVEINSNNVTFERFELMGLGDTTRGIYTRGNYTSITNNIIKGISTGIQTGSEPLIGNNNLTKNIVYSKNVGISLQNSNNTITDNRINAHLEGLGIGSTKSSVNNNGFWHNNFNISSEGVAVRVYNSSHNPIYFDGSKLNASYNYWGSSTPNFTTLVSGNVIYSPWMNNPADVTPNTPEISINDSYTNSSLVNVILKAIGNLPDLFSLSLNNINWTSWMEWGHGDTTDYTVNITDSTIGANSSDGEKTIHVKVSGFSGNENSTHNSSSTTYDTTLATLITNEISDSFENGTNYLISPNGDVHYDKITFDIRYSEKVAKPTIYVENSTGSVIKKVYSATEVENPDPYSWNGTDESNETVQEGKYFIKTNTTDLAGNSNTLTIATVFVKNPSVTIKSSSPGTSTTAAKINATREFSVSVEESENTELNYSWYVDSSLMQSGTNNTFIYNSSSEGEFNITVNATNAAKINATKTWVLTVSPVPVAKTFTSSESTNLSSVENLSAVQDFKLANTVGKIDFGSQTLDLSNTFDLDNSVKIENGIIAIDTTKYPQLNKTATITLKGLSYSTAPKIFYSNGFTTNKNEISIECDFCEIISYTPAPTGNGEVTFTAEHFTSFIVGGSGDIYDINQFRDLEKCENGNAGDLILEIEDPEEGDEFNLGDKIKVKATVSNNAGEEKEIIVKTSLYDITRNNEEDTYKAKSEDISDGGSESFKTDMEVPDDFNEDHDYGIFVKAYERSNEEEQCIQGFVGISLEREKHDVVVKNAVLSSDTAYPGDHLEVFVDVQNIGSSDEEEVYIELRNNELNISERSELFELEQFDDDDSASRFFSVKIPENAQEGDYTLSVKAVFDDGTNEVEKLIKVIGSLAISEKKTQIINLPPSESPNTIPLTGKTISDSGEKYSLIYVLLAGIFVLVVIIMIVLIRKIR